MNKLRMIAKKIVLAVAVFASASVMPVKAQSLLTEEEQEYVNGRETIEAVSLDGVAPLQYTDSNGHVRGISKEVLETISDMTGLVFTYRLYDTAAKVNNSGADIVFGIPAEYAHENMVLSVPFLESETILFLNSSVDPNELDNKKYAAVEGNDLLEGLKKENIVYYKTREEAVDAVDRGEADYGYGNAYSVVFYTIQNGYKNLITVPEKNEIREYCIGLLKNDETLLSIINKSISAISETHMRTLILNEATRVDRKITFPMVMDAYRIQIFAAVCLIIALLLFGIFYNIRAKNEIKIQYERYQTLSQTSNEYLYEYHIKTKRLELSKNCVELFGDNPDLGELTAAFDKVLANNENTIPVIALPVAGGEMGYFKSVNSFIYDDKGRAFSVIGKLIDISEEEAEKQELIKKSETDGLTGIYNAVTARNLITERIKRAGPNSKDALIVMDCDKFKGINDTYGHLQGDEVLANIGKALTQTFRKTDVIGRIGGDEFCVYLRDIPSSDFIVSKCYQLMALVAILNGDNDVTVSIGISLLDGEKSYEDLFRKADKALYQAKKKGGDQVQFYT